MADPCNGYGRRLGGGKDEIRESRRHRRRSRFGTFPVPASARSSAGSKPDVFVAVASPYPRHERTGARPVRTIGSRIDAVESQAADRAGRSKYIYGARTLVLAVAPTLALAA
jgi:hypothetical protein